MSARCSRPPPPGHCRLPVALRLCTLLETGMRTAVSHQRVYLEDHVGEDKRPDGELGPRYWEQPCYDSVYLGLTVSKTASWKRCLLFQCDLLFVTNANPITPQAEKVKGVNLYSAGERRGIENFLAGWPYFLAFITYYSRHCPECSSLLLGLLEH